MVPLSCCVDMKNCVVAVRDQLPEEAQKNIYVEVPCLFRGRLHSQ